MTTCGRCGLLCDDLELDAAGVARLPADSQCALLRDRRQNRECGESIDPAEREFLAGGVRPLILCGGGDVTTTRALVDLARETESVLASQWPPLIPSHYSATLEEVAARSTTVVACGSVLTDLPRLQERFLDTAPRLSAANAPRRVFTLEAVPAPPASLSEIIVALRGQLAGRSITGHASVELDSVATAIRSSSHTSLLYSTDESPAVQAALHDLWSQLDRQQICRLVPLDPDPARLTFRNACTWRSGFQPPVDFSGGLPEGLQYVEIAARLNRVDFDRILIVNAAPAAPLQVASESSARSIQLATSPAHYFRCDGVLILPVDIQS